MIQLPAPTAVGDELVAVTRDFTEHQLLPRTAALDAAQPTVIAEVWQHLVELNLDRALLADDLGGAGIDAADFLRVLHEVAVGDAGVALAVLLHNAAVLSLPAEVAADLPTGARWTLILAPISGNPVDGHVELIQAGGSARATGRLPAVLGGVDAEGVVVTAPAPEPTVFAVRAKTPGLTVRPDPLQMGLRAARSADLVLDNAKLSVAPVPNPVAVESRARSLVRSGMAAISQGIARRAYEVALAYAHTRTQGGVPIVEHGAVSDMLAQMTVRLLSCPVDRLGAGLVDPTVALAYQIAASDAAMATTIDAVQVMGGVGYMVDTGVEKLMRDAKYCQLYPERSWLAYDELIRRRMYY